MKKPAKPTTTDVQAALNLLVLQGRVRVDASGRYTLVQDPPKADWNKN